MEEAYQFPKDVYPNIANFENFIDLSCQQYHCRAWFFTHEYANKSIGFIDENMDIGRPFANYYEYDITDQDTDDIIKVWFKNKNRHTDLP